MTSPLDRLAEVLGRMTPKPWHVSHIDENYGDADIEAQDGTYVGTIRPRCDQSALITLRHVADKLLDVVRAARTASKEIDTFYSKAELCGGVQTINEDDHDLWFGRDEVDTALTALNAAIEQELGTKETT